MFLYCAQTFVVFFLLHRSFVVSWESNRGTGYINDLKYPSRIEYFVRDSLKENLRLTCIVGAIT